MCMDGWITLPIKCKQCGNFAYIDVEKLAFHQWYWTMKSAKELFPHLSENELHMLVNHECWHCKEG